MSALSLLFPIAALGCSSPHASSVPPTFQQAEAGPDSWRLIYCGSLLDRPGQDPRSNATLVVKNGRIDAVRHGRLNPSELSAGAADVEIIDLGEHFVLPGMIDCHTHITSEYTRDIRLRRVEESDADSAIRATVYALRTLEAGFTTIRNVGSSGDAIFALRDAIEEGLIPGPRIMAAGESISPSGGHSDGTHGYREDLFDPPGVHEGIADGPMDCRRAVRVQVKRGADLIKLTATGGVLSDTAAGTEQQFFADELEAIVDTAHQLGRRVAAHAHGARGIAAALRAGVDSIEHGSFLNEECIELFNSTGAFLVPTVMAGETVSKRAQDPTYFPPAVSAKAREVGPVMHDMLRRAHEGGVRIAFGTDSGVSEHGRNAEELLLMVSAGMSNADVLVAATVNAAELCGLSTELGSLVPGRVADVIATLGNPLEDMSRLQHVSFVMRGGEVYKGIEYQRELDR